MRFLVFLSLFPLATIGLSQQDLSPFREYITRGESFIYINSDSARFYFARALETASNKAQEIEARVNLADQYFLELDYDEAIPRFKFVISEFSRDSYPADISYSQFRLGSMFAELGRPDSAMLFYQRAIEIDNDHPTILRPEVRINLAQLQLQLGDAESAEETLRQNLEITRDIQLYQVITLYELSDQFLHRNMPDSFARYHRMYSALMEKDSLDEAQLRYHFQAMFKDEDGNTDIRLLQEVVDSMDVQNGVYKRIGNVLLGLEFLRRDEYQKAYEAGRQAFDIAITSAPEAVLFQHDPVKIMFEARRAQGRDAEALELLLKLNEIDAEVANEQSLKRIDSLQVAYQTQIKENTIIAQRLALSQRTSQRNLLIVALSVFTCIGILLWQRQRARIRVERKEAQINSQRIKALEQENKILAMDAMISGQEEERRRIAKDLHDGLGGILSTVKLSFESIQKEIARLEAFKPYDKAIAMLDNACDEVRRISHDMMPAALSVGGLGDAVRDLGESLENIHGIKTSVQIIGLDENIDDQKEIMIYRIVQELAMNIIRHSKATYVIIQISRHDGDLSIEVEDNGIGFDPDAEFEGLGLKSLHSRVEYMRGSMVIDSAANTGTSTRIRIPL